VVASFVLLLVAEPLAEGQVVGHVEVVETGERWPVRSLEELARLLLARGRTTCASG
jgi:hypothetical protein